MTITLNADYDVALSTALLGYVGETNARPVTVEGLTVDGADRYVLTIDYGDGVTYEVDITGGIWTPTADVLRSAQTVSCQISARRYDNGAYTLVKKSKIFSLRIGQALTDGVAPIPSPSVAVDALDRMTALGNRITADVQTAKSAAETATTAAEFAKKSATAAGVSADTAEQAASRAETAQTAAETSATQAETAMQGADTARQQAVAAQNNAKISADIAAAAAQQTTADKTATAGYAETAKMAADSAAADRQAVADMAEQVEADKTTVSENAAQVSTDRKAAETAAQTALENADSINQLKEDLGEQVGVQKLSGYFNLTKLSNATIYNGKRISQFNTETKEPVLVDDELYTTVIMPINEDYGNYNMIIGANHPTSGIAMVRYKANVIASAKSYSELENTGWDASYDSENNVLSYLTSEIKKVSQSDTYAFCFYDTEPIVYAETLQELDSKVLQLAKIIGIEQLTEDLQVAINNGIGIANLDISLPSVIYSVVGHENNIYFWNILKCSNVNDYTIRVSGANYGSGIKNLGDRVWMKPTEVKKQVLSFKIYKNNQLLKEKTTTVKMIADNQPTGIKAMFIGDSMVENGYPVAELKNMLGDNISFYGTRQGGQKDSSDTWRTVCHEGRSSWHSGEYLSKQTKKGVTNAFYNPDTSAFDFNYYMTNNPSFSDVTDVILQLGNNDVDYLTKEQYVANMQTLVDNIKSYNSNINVYVCIPSSPVNDGYAWGIRNCTDINYNKDKIFDYGKALMEQIQNATIIPIYLNLDNYNDFPKATVARSDRNPETYEVCNDNVHPSKYGFYKFADAFYCSILAKYNKGNYDKL